MATRPYTDDIPLAVAGAGDPAAEFNGARDSIFDLDSRLFTVESAGLLSGFSGWGLPGNVWWASADSNMTSIIAASNNAGTFFGNLAYIPGNTPLLGLRCQIATAAAGGNTMRLGAYKVAPDLSLSLVVDAGTVAIDSTGHKIITGLTPILGKGWYLIGGATTVASVNFHIQNYRPVYGPGFDMNSDPRPPRSWYIPSVGTGALPSSPTGLAKSQDWDSTFVPVLMGW